ncbi:MAG: hypothetical protein ACK5IQ_08315 [Bacteroidales bacterium]
MKWFIFGGCQKGDLRFPCRIVVRACLIVIFALSSFSSFGQQTDLDGTWVLDSVKINKFKQGIIGDSIKYEDLYITSVFSKIKFTNDGDCLLHRQFANVAQASYTSSQDSVVITDNTAQYSYKLSINNGELILSGVAKAADFSGVLEDYKLVMRFTKEN